MRDVQKVQKVSKITGAKGHTESPCSVCATVAEMNNPSSHFQILASFTQDLKF